MVKQIRKRVLAMLMTLAMLISLMPAVTLPAKAEDPIPTILAPGDIAFVMLNCDANPMTWAWVPLVDIESGTTIYFTDNGWNGSTNTFIYDVTTISGDTQNDNLLTFVATTTINKGTVITYNGSNFSPDVGKLSWLGAKIPPYSSSGDQMLAFQGSFASPTFIAGIHMDYNSSIYEGTTKWHISAVPDGLANSSLPLGLTNGANCVSLFPGITEKGNAKYTGATITGTKAELLAAINNYSNWSSVDTTAYTWDRGNFTVNISAPTPEIDVRGGPAQNVSIADGDTMPQTADYTDFGNIGLAGNTTLTYRIYNLGTADLTLTGTPFVAISGDSDFSIAEYNQPTSPITAGNYSEVRIKFQPSTAGLRTATVSIANNDGDENPYNFSIQGTGVNAAPVITNLNGESVGFTEGGTAALLDITSDATVTDGDNANFNGGNLTASITANRVSAEDVLSIANNGTGAGQIGVSGANVSYEGTTIGTFTGGTGTNDLVVTFNSNATPTAAQALIRAITYSNTNNADPSTTSRTVRITVSDGSGGSASADVTVSVTGVNDAPTVGTNTGITVSEGSADTVIAKAKLEVTDVDTVAASITYTLTAAPANGTLKKSETALGVNGTFTQDDINNSRITYMHYGSETASDSFTFTVSDGAGGSIGATNCNITITSVNDAPVVTSSGGITTYTENASPVIIDGGITVSEVDNTTLASATVTISGGFQSGEDVLEFTNDNATTFDNITGSYNGATGVLIMSSAGATATVIQWQNALRAVTYENSSQDPTATNRTISFVVNDGSDNSAADTKAVSVTAVNDAPTLTATTSTPTFTENGAAVALFSGAAVDTVESGQTITELTLTVSNLSDGTSEILNIDGTAVALTNGNSVTSATNTMTCSVMVTGSTATVTISKAGGISTASMQTLVNGIKYSNLSGSPTTGSRAITLTSITDNGGTANIGVDTTTLTIASTVTVVSVPKVTSVTSSNDNGPYGIGATIDITVTFSESVTVTGTPQLTLETVAGDRTVDFASGSGSNTLTFTYTTQAGDETTDLDYKDINSLSGTIKSTANNVDANLALPAPGAENSLGHNKEIVIEAFPTVTLSVSPASISEAGGTSTITASIPVASSQDLVVTIAYTGTATGGGIDYTTTGTTITIPAGSTSANLVGGITATQDTDTEGNETIVVSIDSVSKGVEAVEQQATITIQDDDIPTVLSVSSSTIDGSYKAGDNITVTVTFSASVDVTGTPQLLLETGTADRTIDYVSGSESAVLTFNYNVQAGDNSIDLDYKGTDSLTLNGGTITSGGIAASLTLPTPGAAGSLGANKAIVVDTTAPTATISMSDTALKIGDTSTVTITFSEKITGFTKDDLTFSNGTLTDVSSSDGGITWTATFTPTADITDATNVITLDNTGVQDLAGNVGTGTTDSGNYAIDTLRPTATITLSDNALKAGETSAVTITFSEAVTGFTTDDIATANGALSGITTSDNITFTATFTPTADVTDASNIITLDNTGVQDAEGNAGAGTTNSDNYAIDTKRPSATIVVTDAALKVGETSTVTITFSEAVTGFTTDEITASNGTLSGLASSDGGVTWTATLTPTADFEDATNVITLDNTGVQDAAENTGTGTTESNNYAIDTKIPTATVTVGNTALKVGGTSAVTIAFSEAVTGFTNADLAVANGTLTAVSSVNGGITWTATFTPTADIEDATNVITLNMTGVADAAGNTGTGSTDSNNYEIDTKRPTVTSVAVPSDGKYMTGNTLSFTVNFSEAVTVTGTPTLPLDIGGASVNAAYVSGDNTSALVFAYTIVDGNTDMNGISIGAALSGTIKDAAGNDATLTLNSVGSTLSVLVDTTAPAVGNSGTIGVSELTYNSAKLTWTAATDLGTLAENLQYKAVFSTGDIIDVNAAKLLSGDWTSNITTLTVTGLTASTAYYFNVLVKDEAGNMALYSSATGTTTAAPVYDDSPSTPATPTNNAVVEVNGEKQDAGQTATETTGGTTTTTITVDDTKLDKILEQKGNNSTVTLPASGNPDVVVGQLTGQTVKNMESKEATLEIKTGTATYTLPASQINIDAVSSQFGTQVALKDIKVSVTIAEPPADTVKVVEDTASKSNYQIVVRPVEFQITCTSGDTTVEVSRFNGYVERTIAIPDGIDPSKITTGIVLNADGTFSHVPTSIVVINGKYFAKINSLTNSTYSVIYNPVTFTDVASHWAKDAVNDMGSRMVVTGIGGGIYEPERSITRAEFAAIVVRAMGLKKGTTESAFGDVTLTDWFNGYVDTATAYSLITGYSSESFAPNDTITREQAMTILARAMKFTGLSVTLTDSETSALLSNYTDAGLVSDYARAGAAACIKTGVVSGTTANTLTPKDSVTRAEVAAMVQRLLQKSGLI